MTEPKPIVSIIVASARGGAIGRKGDLLFHISDDLKRFKRLTTGHAILMGRKTYESFPNGALPNRRNIVITRNSGYDRPGIETSPSLEAALAMCDGADEVFIIGGGEIYRQAMASADRIYLTEIDADVPDADTFMPEIEKAAWTVTGSSEPSTDPRSGVMYRFIDLKRKR